MTPDKAVHIMAWDCTPGVFEWHYQDQDEIIYIVSGEAFISTRGQREQRMAAGDVVLFPAGCSCMWRVTQPLTKIAVLRRPLPQPVRLGLRAWRKLLASLRHNGTPTGWELDLQAEPWAKT